MLAASALDAASSRSDSRLRFDQRILLLALAAGFPAAVVALILLWTGDYTPKVQWTLTVFLVGVGTLGGAAHDVPPGRPAAPAFGTRRRQPTAARRRAPGLAAPDSRHRPRDQQFAGADQVDRREPRVDARARDHARGLARRHAARPGGDRGAL